MSNKPQTALLLLLLASVVCFNRAEAQQFLTTHNARSGAMGGLVLYRFGERGAGIDYRQEFMTNGMADKAIWLSAPVHGSGQVGVHYSHYGNLDYHEQQLGAGYALRATEWLRIGASARWLHLGSSDSRYRPRQWLAAELLLHMEPSTSTSFEVAAGTRPWDSCARFHLRLGTAYRPVSQLLTALAVEQEDRLRFRLGMEYGYEKHFFVRAGMHTAPVTFCFGLGIRYGHYAFDLAAEVHSVLGITPQTSLVLWF